MPEEAAPVGAIAAAPPPDPGAGEPIEAPGPVPRGLRLEVVLLALVLLLAAWLRLPGLDERGRWDADQGHDMLELRALVTEGRIPLLGPRTSIGTFHHGALYYLLLAPAAVAFGDDPVAVTAWIALFGIAAVAATWWLGRLAGGPVAGTAAGLLAAISPAGIDESTFIWNPNLIPVGAALALAAVVRARSSGDLRWWPVAGFGATIVAGCHVLGAILVVPVAASWALDLRARRRRGGAGGPHVRAGLGAVAILVAGFAPLIVHELGSGFTETRAIVAHLAGAGGGSEPAIADRLVAILLRSVSWPLTGLLTDRPAAAILAAVAVAGLAGLAVTGPTSTGRSAARLLLATLAWSIPALALLAPSLAVVVPELPNDHYHAFLDPVVLVLAGAGIARLAGGAGANRQASARADASLRAPDGAPVARRHGRAPRRAIAGALLVGLVALAIPGIPPRVAADGGWRLAESAAARVRSTTGTGPIAVDGIPALKSADALVFPLLRGGVLVAGDALPAAPGAGTPTTIVVVCDPLFDEVTGVACGGPAESAWSEDLSEGARGRALVLVERFAAGSRRVVSIYEVAGP